MILAGLTGGVASGKTTVAKMFAHCGAVVIDADALAREAVAPGKPAWRDIVRAFGRDVMHPDHTINRPRLAALVFGNQRRRRLLERIVHPRVAREQRRLVRQAEARNAKAVVVYDVPLLFEAGIDSHVDRVIVVTADRETQIARLQRRNGLTRADATRRIKSQLPLAFKRRRADYVLDGTLPTRQLAKQVRRIYAELAAAA